MHTAPSQNASQPNHIPSAIAMSAMPQTQIFPNLAADQTGVSAHSSSSLYAVLLSKLIIKACIPVQVSHESAIAMAGLGTWHKFASQSTVLEGGVAPAKSLWLLVEGQTCLGKTDRSGRWWQSMALGPGEWIDVSSAWTNSPYSETARALTSSLVHEFPIEEVEAHCLRDRSLARALLASVASKACRSTLQRQALLTEDANTRIASWLLECSQASHEAHDAEISLKQQKRDIASQLGLTPETLSRGLRRLQEMGLLIMRGYRIKLPDLRALRIQAGAQFDNQLP